jgi:hypothetical protein
MQSSLTERDQITRTIDRYFAGLYNGSRQDIEASFHPNAAVCGFMSGGGELAEMYYGRFVEFVGTQAAPAENGEPFEMTIDSIEVKGRMAMARVTDRYLGKRFTDLLLLLKMDEGWRIYSKLWHADPL